jgi:transposase
LGGDPPVASGRGMPIKAIARVVGVSKNTVKRALADDGPPRYERSPRGSIVDGVEPRIRELLAAWPTMPATVIAERIGWTKGLTVLRDRVRELRPVHLPPDPASRMGTLAPPSRLSGPPHGRHPHAGEMRDA